MAISLNILPTSDGEVVAETETAGVAMGVEAPPNIDAEPVAKLNLQMHKNAVFFERMTNFNQELTC